jgi:hypothetical protein
MEGERKGGREGKGGREEGKERKKRKDIGLNKVKLVAFLQEIIRLWR